jgi:acetyl-CoA carboxylase biotin carboxylase subunit
VLIANRGEIAVRIIRACREARVETVAVYSDADAGAMHVRAADAAVRLGPPAPSESYLSVPALIAAARASEADAVHPGYGFLSERAEFARACVAAGLVFIGPPAAVIEKMGSKIAARELMRASGIPTVPGETPRDQGDEGVRNAARSVGYPVLVKASAGGGGKGMRILHEDGGALESIAAARREATASFGEGTLYVERLIARPRHIEVQIMADACGHIVHLFERECSVQRRHQKIVEESPSVALTPALRAAMGQAAVAAAKAAGYLNAGTVEFLIEGSGDGARFYFLEMNTRLQVEHPVTEAVAGVDLVRAQLEVAEGRTLPWTQDALAQRGHAVECRVYAEDASNGFLPQAGRLLLYREPRGPGIRVDGGVEEGNEVGVNYDPLLAKVIAFGESRDAAIDRAVRSLREYPVLGIRTNIGFLTRLLQHPDFRAGRLHTGFVDEHLEALTRVPEPPPEAIALAALGSSGAPPASIGGEADQATAPDPWTILERWGR